MSSDPPAVVAIVGPTAVGKTELALGLAHSFDAEIVSIDSMQIYRGMDIGTAKPSPEDRARVPHHLIDVADPIEDVTVARFQRWARDAVADVVARGRTPLLVGGSGLYFRAVVDDLEFPPRDPNVRARIEEAIDREGSDALYRRLQELDPAAAARIEPSNARRIARALEAIAVSGRRFSGNVTWGTYESIYDLTAIGVTRGRAALYERIEARVDRMLAAGLEDEARRLAERGMGATARQALGYRQVLEATEGESVRDAIVRATKRFARRQESWFRQDPRIEWFDAADQDLAERVREHVGRHVALP